VRNAIHIRVGFVVFLWGCTNSHGRPIDAGTDAASLPDDASCAVDPTVSRMAFPGVPPDTRVVTLTDQQIQQYCHWYVQYSIDLTGSACPRCTRDSSVMCHEYDPCVASLMIRRMISPDCPQTVATLVQGARLGTQSCFTGDLSITLHAACVQGMGWTADCY
jgi:hypothetical protein